VLLVQHAICDKLHRHRYDALLCELRDMGITAHRYLVLGCPTASALMLPQHKYSKTTTKKTVYGVILDV
jgi:hypothetical protein